MTVLVPAPSESADFVRSSCKVSDAGMNDCSSNSGDGDSDCGSMRESRSGTKGVRELGGYISDSSANRRGY